VIDRHAVTIRDALRHEHSGLLELVMDSYQGYLELTPELLEGFRQEVMGLMDDEHTEVIAAEVDGSLAGSVVFYPDGQHYGPGSPPGFSALRVLAVGPQFRRMGLGRELMTECLRRAKELGRQRVLLHTLPNMENAIALHESLGFKRAPEFDVEYMPEVTVLAYALDL
jgi:ribosomal protein S18 acetylase RimI-like enzyme